MPGITAEHPLYTSAATHNTERWSIRPRPYSLPAAEVGFEPWSPFFL